MTPSHLPCCKKTLTRATRICLCSDAIAMHSLPFPRHTLNSTRPQQTNQDREINGLIGDLCATTVVWGGEGRLPCLQHSSWDHFLTGPTSTDR